MNIDISIISTIVFALLIVGTFIGVLARFRIANSNQVLVVTGKIKDGKSSKTIHGGATFVIPVLQQYQYLDLSPIQIDIDLRNALSSQNIRVNVPSSFTVAIGTEPNLMTAASERLLDKTTSEIAGLARDIIFGQLRATIADMSIEEINRDRDKFIGNIRSNVEIELKKIGLIVLNVNVTDITDESGYITALGQKAASEAINKAKVDVAKQDRDGNVGEAVAKQDERIKTAEANASAVLGENDNEKRIAESNADLKVKQEEARRKETTATLVNQAQAEKDGYDAQKITEEAKALQEEAKLKAEIIVPAEARKRELIIKSEAEKEQEILQGQAEGEAIRAKMEGEAKGIQLILDAKAEGFKNIVQSAGTPEAAIQLMLVEQLPEIAKIQVEAIKNLKIDKITVWDSGKNKEGNGSTANFLNGMMNILPPLSDVLKQGGVQIPEWMGKDLKEFPNKEEKYIIDKNQIDIDNNKDK